MTNSIPEFETDTNCFLIMGSNTSEGHPLIASRIMKAKERGAKVIVIDPRETQMARLADLYLPFRPGADVAILNGLMNVIISEGLEDKAFIAERTEAYDEMKAVVEKYTPERVRGDQRHPGRQAARGGAHVRHEQAVRLRLRHGHHAAHHRRGQRQDLSPTWPC